jgi:ABC-type transporter Mla subunit MlaD
MMSGFMGIGGSSMFGIFLNAASLTTPYGWAMMAAKQLMMQFGEQLIQQIGDKLGLPQGMIDMAQGAFRAQVGDFQGAARNLQEAVQAFGESVGADQRQIDEANADLDNMIANAATQMAERGKDAMKGGGAKSWIMAIAIAMGKQIDKKAKEMQGMADKITDKTPSLTAKFSAASQEFGIMMNALTTVIKTLGEAMANTARKQ